ncbi:MAG: Uma2 family endonuclease [Synechococcales bacterium]|nr:Uma2 family endonuclease [Synechococcales bacterium]
MTPLELQTLGITLPPTQDELPCSDGIPMETERHNLQMRILIDGLLPWLALRQDGYIGGNMFIYYSLRQVKNQDFRGPDVFVVLDVPKGERKSWICWEEDKVPDVVIELLSDSTREFDKTEKKLIYQNRMRVPEYFWYDPFNPSDIAGFYMQNGCYQPIAPNPQGLLVSQMLGLALVRWQGTFKQVTATWLRWADLQGQILLTDEELAQQKADEAQQKADEAQQKVDAQAAQLRQLVRHLMETGMPSDRIAQLAGLTPAQLEELE